MMCVFVILFCYSRQPFDIWNKRMWFVLSPTKIYIMESLSGVFVQGWMFEKGWMPVQHPTELGRKFRKFDIRLFDLDIIPKVIWTLFWCVMKSVCCCPPTWDMEFVFLTLREIRQYKHSMSIFGEIQGWQACNVINGTVWVLGFFYCIFKEIRVC